MGLKPPKHPPPKPLAFAALLGSVAMTIGGYAPWARTATKTVWGSNSGGAGVGTAGLAALVLSALIVGGRRWPATILLLLASFASAATAYYVLDARTVASDAGLKGDARAEWGLYLALAGSFVAAAAAFAIARLRRRPRPTPFR
jgi:hypothetical protein